MSSNHPWPRTSRSLLEQTKTIIQYFFCKKVARHGAQTSFLSTNNPWKNFNTFKRNICIKCKINYIFKYVNAIKKYHFLLISHMTNHFCYERKNIDISKKSCSLDSLFFENLGFFMVTNNKNSLSLLGLAPCHFDFKIETNWNTETDISLGSCYCWAAIIEVQLLLLSVYVLKLLSTNLLCNTYLKR